MDTHINTQQMIPTIRGRHAGPELCQITSAPAITYEDVVTIARDSLECGTAPYCTRFSSGREWGKRSWLHCLGGRL